MAKAKEKPQPWAWITGNYYECRKKWHEILAELDDPQVETLDCGYNPESCAIQNQYSTAEDVMRVLRTKDMFDDRPRIVRMRGLPADYIKLADNLKYATETNRLVVDAPLGYYGQHQRFVPAGASNFYKLIASKGSLYKFDIEAKSDAVAIAWVRRVSKEIGKEIDPVAAELLVSMKGHDLDMLYSELKKLHAFETAKTVGIEAVKNCCVPAYLQSVWDFVDALDRQQFDESFTILQGFHQNAGVELGSTIRGDVEQMLGALQYHYEMLLYVKDACPNTLTYTGLMAGITGIKKLKEPKSDDTSDDDTPITKSTKVEYPPKFSPGAAANALRNPSFVAAYGWPKSKIYATLRDIMRCRWRLRQFNPHAAKIRLMLDSLCLSICGKLTESQLLGMIGYSGREIRHITTLMATE